MKKIYSFSDCHGDYDRLTQLLQEHKIIDNYNNWVADDNILINCGDIVDRGKQGIAVIKLMMKLEEQATQSGGLVISLLGNHDSCIVAVAYELQGELAHQDCKYLFKYNGGNIQEANTIANNEELFNWMKNRPLMYKIDNLLFQHADTCNYYLKLGKTIEEINNYGLKMLQSGHGAFHIFANMTDCRWWDKYYVKNVNTHINDYLKNFGVDTVIHGHTRFDGSEPEIKKIGNNTIINIDGTLSNGYRSNIDRGFIVEFFEDENSHFSMISE